MKSIIKRSIAVLTIAAAGAVSAAPISKMQLSSQAVAPTSVAGVHASPQHIRVPVGPAETVDQWCAYWTNYYYAHGADANFRSIWAQFNQLCPNWIIQ